MAFKLFKKKSKASIDRYSTLIIREVLPIATDAVNLVFEKPSKAFEYQPGQFLTIIDSINGNKIRRAYSLCSNPFEDEFPAVTVKRVSEGRMSNHINDKYKKGQSIQVMEPMGLFTTTFDESQNRKVVFIGGGSGITPLYSLMRSILMREPKSEVTLIYGNRREEFVIFKEQLKDLGEKHSERFKLTHLLEEDENGFADIEARLSPEIIQEIVSSNGLKGAEYFICGPQPMMDVAAEGLKQAGIEDSRIRLESFDAGVTSPKGLVTEDKNKGSNVTIILEGEEHLVPVSMESSILETALDAGLDMPYSCQSGLCTACRGKCLEGDITKDDAEGLSDEELEEGYRLLCIGKPITDNITVEIG